MTDDPLLDQLQAANPDVEMHGMDGYGFFAEGDAQECVLPPGHRFIAVVGGCANSLFSVTEPGVYEIDAPPLPEGGMWPQMVMVVADENVQAVMNMPAEATRELVRMITGQRDVQ